MVDWNIFLSNHKSWKKLIIVVTHYFGAIQHRKTFKSTDTFNTSFFRNSCSSYIKKLKTSVCKSFNRTINKLVKEMGKKKNHSCFYVVWRRKWRNYKSELLRCYSVVIMIWGVCSNLIHYKLIQKTLKTQVIEKLLCFKS